MEEQLTELASALKLQFQRHCFIQIRQNETQPMLVPFVEPVLTFTYNRTNLDYYVKRQHEKQEALPAAEVDLLLDKQETALLEAAAANILASPGQAAIEMISNAPQPPDPAAPIWTRTEIPESAFKTQERKRGPKADTENHEKVVLIVRAFGEAWTSDDSLLEICEELDRQEVPAPKTWATPDRRHRPHVEPRPASLSAPSYQSHQGPAEGRRRAVSLTDSSLPVMIHSQVTRYDVRRPSSAQETMV